MAPPPGIEPGLEEPRSRRHHSDATFSSVYPAHSEGYSATPLAGISLRHEVMTLERMKGAAPSAFSLATRRSAVELHPHGTPPENRTRIDRLRGGESKPLT